MMDAKRLAEIKSFNPKPTDLVDWAKLQTAVLEYLPELVAEVTRLQQALEQSKASHKRIKADCRYVDYSKLQRRFFSKCEENERLRKALERITEHRVNHFITKDAMVTSMFETAKGALQNGD